MKQNRLKQIVKWDGANQDKNVPKGTDQCNKAILEQNKLEKSCKGN